MKSDELNKLVDILRQYSIRISTKGNICLNDLVLIIIETDAPKKYMHRIKDKISSKQKDKYYVTPEKCFEVLRWENSHKCKEIIKQIDEQLENVINKDDNIFRFNGYRFQTFVTNQKKHNSQMWIKGSEIASYLGYTNANNAIVNILSKENMITYNKLMLQLPVGYIIKNAQPHAIFINYEGILQLISRSDKVSSVQFAKFLGLDIYRVKSVRKEINVGVDIVRFCDKIGVKCFHQFSVKNKKNKNYKIDFYIPDYKIAIEIDEHGHKDRYQIYENKREDYIKKQLGCTFLRYNPDSPNFNIVDIMADLHRLITESI